ncbi:hypothetical protein THAOC_24149, partial [Thalassiosira oceanica]
EAVQPSVHTEQEDIVSGQVLDDPVLSQYVQLRHDGDGFEDDAEHPHQLLRLDDRTITGGRTRAHLYPRSQRGGRQDEALEVGKVVEIPVVRGRDRPVPLDEVYHATVEEYERDLHHRVVPAVERRDEVRVPRQADEEVELVRLEADALRVSRGLEPPHQDDDGGEAAHVAAKADGVHGHVVCGLMFPPDHRRGLLTCFLRVSQFTPPYPGCW